MRDFLDITGINGYMAKFGATPDIDAADANEDLWDGTGAYAFPAAAAAMKVSSSSANDTSDGTGARTVRVEGLDSNYLEVSEDVTLNGQTAVTTTQTFLRVHRAYVLTAGTGTVNAGDVWVGTGDVTAGVPAVKYAGILTGLGQTLMAIYTIPGNRTSARVIRWYATVGGSTATFATLALQKREFGGAWRTQRLASVALGEWFEENLPFGVTLGAKCDVRIRCVINGANNTRIQGGFDIVLED